jgi:hypothetical protein
MIYQSEKRVSSLVRRLLWPVARSSIWNIVPSLGGGVRGAS